jgi:hypothetical protein
MHRYAERLNRVLRLHNRLEDPIGGTEPSSDHATAQPDEEVRTGVESIPCRLRAS